MNRRPKFALAKCLILIVIVIGLAGSSFVAWKHDQREAAMNSPAIIHLDYDSPPTTTASAPVVISTAGLAQSMNTLNNTDVTGSAVDNAQLGLQASNF